MRCDKPSIDDQKVPIYDVYAQVQMRPKYGKHGREGCNELLTCMEISTQSESLDDRRIFVQLCGQ